jgi:hypothetical protein
MDRRAFLKSSLHLVAALGAVLPALPGISAPRDAARAPSTARSAAPDFVELGSPYRKSCDAASAAGIRRDPTLFREDWIHHRMPDAWRDRFVLGIAE